jgi:hypothetical protein
VARRRSVAKAPLAVAAIASTPLFFTALMAMSLAVEKPTFQYVFVHKLGGYFVPHFGDPSGSNETKIWLLTILFPLGLVLVGAGAMLMGRFGIVPVALAAIGASLALRLPLHTWATHHTARFPFGVDNIPRSAGSEDIYLPGEWEGTASHTAQQLALATIVIAGIALALFVLFELRRRRGPLPPPAEPAPDVVAGQVR